MARLGAFRLNMGPISKPKPVLEPLSPPESSPHAPHQKFLSEHVHSCLIKKKGAFRRVWTKNGTDLKTETCFGILEPTQVQPTRAPSKIPVQTCLFWSDQEMARFGAFRLNMGPISKPIPVSEPLSPPKSSPHAPRQKILPKHVCSHLIKGKGDTEACFGTFGLKM